MQEEQVDPLQLHRRQAGLQRGAPGCAADLAGGGEPSWYLVVTFTPAGSRPPNTSPMKASQLRYMGAASSTVIPPSIAGREGGQRLLVGVLAPDLADAAAAQRQAADLAKRAQCRGSHLCVLNL